MTQGRVPSGPGSVATAADRPARALTETERNWLLAALILLGSLVLFGIIYAVELDSGRWNADLRLVMNPAEASMRYLGISHFLVAFLFLTTSKKMRAPRPWLAFAVALGIGTVLCLAYARVKVWSPVVATMLFFGYFVVHDFRDQVFFYFSNGDAPAAPDRKGLGALLFRTPFLVLAVLVAGVAALMASGALDIAWLGAAIAAWPPAARWALGLLPAAGAALLISRYRELWRRENLGKVGDFARANRPILAVLAAALLILIAQKGFAIVTLHVTCWYIFALHQLRKRPATPAPKRFSWSWLRATPAGFNVLHIGSVVLLVAVGAVWAYGFRNDPTIAPLRILLDPASFQYWTIVHVTASFSGR
jgi:hypothetical protein